METNAKELDDIALNYHTNESIPDIHIENLCQQHFISWLSEYIKPNKKVLELGYGDGIVTAALASSGSDLTLIEGANILVKKAKEKHPNINCVHTMFEDFLPNQSFDLIIAAHVLEHLENPLDLLNKISSWLSDEGILIVVVPNRNSLHRKLAVSMGFQPQLDTLSKRDLMVGHKRVYSLDGLVNEMVSANFNVVGKYGFFVKLLPNSMMLDYSKELLWAMNRISADLPPELMANIAVTATKNNVVKSNE
jgi:SAM-dependent methyltransferase